MTELEQTLLAALRRQDAALQALSDRANQQQTQIDQLTELVTQQAGYVSNMTDLLNELDQSRPRLGRR